MTPRSLLVLFRRAPSADKQVDAAALEGYTPFWPDGRPVAVGLNAFCVHGQRLLRLGKHLAGRDERLVRIVCHPVTHREAHIVRISGYRVRRFCLVRDGSIGRLHFLDGTPTSATFDLNRDEADALAWIGLNVLADGERQWVDIAAVAVEESSAEIANGVAGHSTSSWTDAGIGSSANRPA
ncbi:MAG TPA: hypothetical protein VE988_19445 [Gemmataceae bacterium]|nr:hypothetical protein [Gemmataceae bacterium]